MAPPGEVRELVLATAAAQELEVEVLAEPERMAGMWRSAGTVVVAGELARRVASAAPTARPGVFLVGSDAEQLAAWSAPLAAGVIQLPEGGAWLGAVLADGRSRFSGPVVAVLGGSGGVGASTLAASLAHLGAERAEASALVDVDPLGGGLDLLLGAERVSGWRWPRLEAADGRLGDLRGYLPVVDGVTVVSMARGPAFDLSREPLAAIVGALRSWHSLVVLDVGRCGGPAAREALRLAGRQLLVASASVRGVAAARQVVAEYELERAELVLRRGRGSLDSALVAEAVGLPILGEIPTDLRLVEAADSGEPPARGVRRGYRRAVDALVRRVLADADD
ncbi:secretion/DNA translocation related CpaE-like protein [Propionicimonas paludicola]|uniref:Secretion/DNA translocation related CpaE-like protein n=1 Tax=Propionicimonas paludicola TaxID=185243 RepID=A0A2A9CVV1_9ACTN|nr:secretion/DNA translocation related CpaE-like protein [Propionicimonas paludicola]